MAVRYLRKAGVQTVSVVGGSMGGAVAGDASIEAEPGEIDRLVLHRSGGSDHKPEKHHAKTPGPKELIVLEGSAHAQFLFATDQGDRVMREISACPFREMSQ
jgi:hypothetical protein